MISFEIPPNFKKQYAFKAGQYLTLSANIKGEQIKRSYSICSSPKSQNLQVGVKAIENGVFSNYVNDALREGDSIEVSTPEGRFVLENNDQDNYCAFVAGSGITPLMSIITDILENNENSVFVLGYGNKTKASTMFSSAIDELKSKYSNRFFCYNIYSQENNLEARFGRIDAGFINYVLKQHPQISFQKVLLCGPENMIENSKEVLEKLNYSDKKVLYELFYSKSDANVSKSGSGSAAKIIYDEETIELDVPKKMTILDAALQKNIDVPYSCQGGVCSSCIAKITVGSATMIQNNILTDSEIKEGLVLTCQAVPQTNEITVDYDDV